MHAQDLRFDYHLNQRESEHLEKDMPLHVKD
jgi:hypothetical protein